MVNSCVSHAPASSASTPAQDTNSAWGWTMTAVGRCAIGMMRTGMVAKCHSVCRFVADLLIKTLKVQHF